ncbi:Holliday junction branch migration protein RuvA [bacterium]|nr:Holliday junction branch migration protein RuvA [bacterium]
MFNYIKGIVAEITPLYCVIDCNGVGYEIEIPLSTYEKIRSQTELKLLIHHHQNDEGVRLFGFLTLEEKLLFRKLISISRVGPKIALSMLSALPVSTLVNSILHDDYSLLSKIPGLGKKTAQRLIIELKDKVGDIEISGQEYGLPKLNDVAKEAETALLTLGYKPFEIRRTFQEILSEEPQITVESLIKRSIKNLYKKG